MTEVKAAEDHSLGFGFAELAYILQLQETPASQTSAERLRLLDESRDSGFIRAGLSSLIARRLAQVAKDSVVTFDSRVDVVVYTLAHAVRWTQLDLLESSELGDSVLHVESDKTRLLFQPRTMLTWFAVPQDGGVTAERAETYLMREHLRNHPDGGVRLRTEGAAGSGEVLVKRDNDNWVYAAVSEGVVGEPKVAVDETALLYAVQEVRTAVGEDGSGQ